MNIVEKVSAFLKGKKSYIFAIAIAIVVFLQHAAIISPELAKQLLTLLGAGSIASLRAGMKK